MSFVLVSPKACISRIQAFIGVAQVLFLSHSFSFPFLFSAQQNRPLNTQNVADALQKFNLKKAAIQKALDALADNGRISFKEYGKQKIYLARQDQFDIPNNEELNRMKEENANLQQQLQEQRRVIGEVEGGTLCTPFLYVLQKVIWMLVFFVISNH